MVKDSTLYIAAATASIFSLFGTAAQGQALWLRQHPDAQRIPPSYPFSGLWLVVLMWRDIITARPATRETRDALIARREAGGLAMRLVATILSCAVAIAIISRL